MIQNSVHKQENSPYIQFLYLLLFAIGGLIVLGILGFVVIFFTYGLEDLKATLVNDISQIGAVKILLIVQQIGLFLVPALLLGFIERKKPSVFYGLALPKANILLLVAILSICWMPIISGLNEWNQKMVFPEFLKGLEKWMRSMEDQTAVTTEAILKMNNLGTFFINLIVIAVAPAICEEFIFRGALQRTVFRLKSNPHVAIWLTAIIFSTIHFQFYGFLPRVFLGAAFGYLYYFTGSIWYAVFAHFLNNAYAVVVAYYLQFNNKSYSEADSINMPWFGYLISAILTLALFKILKDKTQQIQAERYDNI